MLSPAITLLVSLAVATATSTVQVTVVNDRTKYNGDKWNTTVDVPFPGKSAELSLPNAVRLSISGGRGVNVEKVICTPTWLASAGEVLGTKFKLGEISWVVKGSIGLHLIRCVPSGSALQVRDAADVGTQDVSAEDLDLSGPPEADCLEKKLADVGDPYPCTCFLNGQIKSDNYVKDAIDGACNYFKGGTVGSEIDWKYWHHYPPNDEDEGVLLLRIAWHGEDEGYCDKMTWKLDEFNSQFRDKCVASFWGLFANTNDASDPSDDQHGCGLHRGGGWGTDSCLTWEFDANPGKNNPDLHVDCINYPADLASEESCRF